jgi:hypothetical protein
MATENNPNFSPQLMTKYRWTDEPMEDIPLL